MQFKKIEIVTEKNIIIGLIALLIITTLIDIFTALSSDIFNIAEANPIYNLFGLKPLLLATIIVTAWIIMTIKNNQNVSLVKLFFIVNIIIYLSYGHLIGITTNVLSQKAYEKNPVEIKKTIEGYTTSEKIAQYNLIIGLLVALPYSLSITTFFLAYSLYIHRKNTREYTIHKIKKMVNKL